MNVPKSLIGSLGPKRNGLFHKRSNGQRQKHATCLTPTVRALQCGWGPNSPARITTRSRCNEASAACKDSGLGSLSVCLLTLLHSLWMMFLRRAETFVELSLIFSFSSYLLSHDHLTYCLCMRGRRIPSAVKFSCNKWVGEKRHAFFASPHSFPLQLSGTQPCTFQKFSPLSIIDARLLNWRTRERATTLSPALTSVN